MSSVANIPTTSPSIPEKSWENPFTPGTYLHDLFDTVLNEERDLIIIVDDYLGRRGTGKTIACLKLGDSMDQNNGMSWGKCAMQAERLRNSYSDQPIQSALCMDEGEMGLSNRDPMTNTNKAIREVCSMGRVEQKYLLINAPIKSFIDKDIQRLADVWITMIRRGKGLVHELRWEPYSETLLTPRKQWIEFDDIPKGTELRNVYNKLTQEKKAHLDGESGRDYVEKSEHKEILNKEREKVKLETRNEIIRRIYDNEEIVNTCGVSQRMIGESIGLTQQQVGNIVRGEA